MNEQMFLLQFYQLPTNLQKEVLDFMAFLLQKQQIKKMPETNKPIRKAGSMKGLIVYMSEDFNAPMDDFKDYM